MDARVMSDETNEVGSEGDRMSAIWGRLQEFQSRGMELGQRTANHSWVTSGSLHLPPHLLSRKMGLLS